MHTTFAGPASRFSHHSVGPVEQYENTPPTYSIGNLNSGARARRPHGEGPPIVFVVARDIFFDKQPDPLAFPFGWQIERFQSATDFLGRPPLLSPSCLLIDAATSELDLLELQQRVAIDRPGMPIILATGSGDAPSTVLAAPVGMVNVLPKPVCDDLLVRAIENALRRSQPAFDHWCHTRVLRGRYESLTAREREVMALVVYGKLNKQVGGDLGISEITVKAHRGSVMRKMRAASLASLVTMAACLGPRTLPVESRRRD